jgi:hypothetical protein
MIDYMKIYETAANDSSQAGGSPPKIHYCGVMAVVSAVESRVQGRIIKQIKFRCIFCGKEFDTVGGCNACEESH